MNDTPKNRPKPWRKATAFAVPIVILVTSMYYNWFALRDRYFVFLYHHDMGAGFDTSPFGRVTVSRYWMTGLVASGLVLVLYTTANWILGRLRKGYHPPAWWRVWILCAIPLMFIIPAIVMNVNNPILPFRYTTPIIIALLTGLALATSLAKYCVNYSGGFVLLIIDGFALALVLMAIRSTELIQRYLARGNPVVVIMVALMLAFGLGTIAVLSFVYRKWPQLHLPDWISWLLAGFNTHYLILPLIHHLFMSTDSGSWTDPDYFTYISDADNFFSQNWLFQVAVWVLVAGIAWGITKLRQHLRLKKEQSTKA